MKIGRWKRETEDGADATSIVSRAREERRRFGETNSRVTTDLNPHTCVHYTIPDIGEICWTEGGWEMTPVDFETMLCLIDLHTAQKATCIDTKGSKCANKHEELDGPFTAIGGAKKRPHVKILGFPFNPNKARYGKLPAQGAEALKLMIGALYMKGPGFMKFNLNTEIDMRITAHWGKHAKHKFLIRGTGSHDC